MNTVRVLKELNPDGQAKRLLKDRCLQGKAIDAAILRLSRLEPQTRTYFVFTGPYSELLKKREAKVMVSYGAVLKKRRNLDRLLDGFAHIMLDSGGYQLQSGAIGQLGVDSYASWLLEEVLPKHCHAVDGYANLDILDGSGRQTLQNQKVLESHGLTPIPVWHQGEDRRVLDYYCQNYPLVAIGGLVGTTTGQLWALFNWLHQRYPGQKFHIFGVGLSLLNYRGDFRAYSFDCSTWNVPGRFGQLLVWGSDWTSACAVGGRRQAGRA